MNRYQQNSKKHSFCQAWAGDTGKLTEHKYACRCQAGSALAETLLIVPLMVFMTTGLVAVGKLLDIRQTTEQAARYATWQGTVQAHDTLAEQLDADVQSRFFAQPAAAISSQPSEHSSENPWWGARQPDAADNPEIRRASDQAVSVGYQLNINAAEMAETTAKAAAFPGQLLERFKGNSWNLQTNGMLQTRVSVPLETTSWLKGIGNSCLSTSADEQSDNTTCMHGSGVILSDGWEVADKGHAVKRVRSLTASTLYGDVAGRVAHVGGYVFKELRDLEQAFGFVNMDVLPEYARP